MGKMMDVILEDRNEVVFHDLKALLEGPDKPETIGIIYGAGHLPTMEKRLVEELGYRPAGDTWNTAMQIDPEAAGMTQEQFASFRKMTAQMVKQQLEAARKLAKKKKKPAA
jgi:hypothetical protein